MNQPQLFDEPKSAKQPPRARLLDCEPEAPTKASSRIVAGHRWPTYVNDPRPPGYEYLGPQRRDFPTYSDEEYRAWMPYADDGSVSGTIRRMLDRPGWRLLIEDFQANGVADEELLEWVGYEWGLGGGASGQGLTSYSYVGGSNPAFALSESYTNVRENGLTGKKLAAAIREGFGFPHAGGATQAKLWGEAP